MLDGCARFVWVAALALLAIPVAADPAPRASARIDRGADAKPRCARVVAATFSSRDFVLVGEVHQGRKRAVLMMDSATHNHGHVVRPGECFGRERVPFDRLRRPPVEDLIRRVLIASDGARFSIPAASWLMRRAPRHRSEHRILA